MRYGSVATYFPDKKFGFIRPDEGPDVFFHASAIDGCDAAEPEIKVGQPVKFETAPPPSSSKGSSGPAGSGNASRRDQPKAARVILMEKPPGAALNDTDRGGPQRHQRARRKKPTWRR